ncbi:MAG: hypothetical protein H7249_02420 [Chitinophagaceae bacterium]|nr:hypothetical protein [Oligoflexus sp.]
MISYNTRLQFLLPKFPMIGITSVDFSISIEMSGQGSIDVKRNFSASLQLDTTPTIQVAPSDSLLNDPPETILKLRSIKRKKKTSVKNDAVYFL